MISRDIEQGAYCAAILMTLCAHACMTAGAGLKGDMHMQCAWLCRALACFGSGCEPGTAASLRHFARHPGGPTTHWNACLQQSGPARSLLHHSGGPAQQCHLPGLLDSRCVLFSTSKPPQNYIRFFYIRTLSLARVEASKAVENRRGCLKAASLQPSYTLYLNSACDVYPGSSDCLLFST